MAETTEQPRTPLERIGQQLQEAREAKNFSLEHVAKVTRIRISILKDIEQGHMAHSPGPAFLRGFIRTYGELMGLDSETLQKEIVAIPELQKFFGISGSNIIPAAIEHPSWQEPKYSIFLLILIILGGGYFLFNYFDQRPTQLITESQPPDRNNSPAKPAPPDVDKKQPPPQEQSLAENQPPTENKMAPQQQAVTKTTETPPIEDPAVLTTAPAVIEEEQPASVPTQPELLSLSIKATQATWLNIAVDEEDPIEISLQSGEEYPLEAKERYTLTVGNTKGIELFLNGKPQAIDQQNELLENWVLDKSSLENTE